MKITKTSIRKTQCDGGVMNSSFYDDSKANLGVFGGCVFERMEEGGINFDVIVKDSITSIWGTPQWGAPPLAC